MPIAIFSRRLAITLAALTLAACTAGTTRYDRLLTPKANPSAVVATELAFARAAQEDGQWKAFRDYSTSDAVMFVPQAVKAHDWLRGRDEPAQALRWQPHQVWSSCDGSLAVTKGAWQRPDGTVGYFTTIWERQGRRGDARYLWVLDQGDALSAPLEPGEFIKTEVADCAADEIVVQADGPAVQFGGMSEDRTLAWHVNVNDDLSRELTVSISRGGEMRTAVESIVAAPAG
jgi:hypothetical protein